MRSQGQSCGGIMSTIQPHLGAACGLDQRAAAQALHAGVSKIGRPQDPTAEHTRQQQQATERIFKEREAKAAEAAEAERKAVKAAEAAAAELTARYRFGKGS